MREDIGRGERRKIGGRDDGEIEPTRNQRYHHGEREDPKFRKLKGHGADGRAIEQLAAEEHGEERDQRQEEQGQT
jgi:hypothetical protein